jgi:hypothetical protein
LYTTVLNGYGLNTQLVKTKEDRKYTQFM